MPQPDLELRVRTLVERSVPESTTVLGLGMHDQLRDTGFDSVAMLMVLDALERELGVVVSDDDLDDGHFDTLASLTEFVWRKIGNGKNGARQEEPAKEEWRKA